MRLDLTTDALVHIYKEVFEQSDADVREQGGEVKIAAAMRALGEAATIEEAEAAVEWWDWPSEGARREQVVRVRRLLGVAEQGSVVICLGCGGTSLRIAQAGDAEGRDDDVIGRPVSCLSCQWEGVDVIPCLEDLLKMQHFVCDDVDLPAVLRACLEHGAANVYASIKKGKDQ